MLSYFKNTYSALQAQIEANKPTLAKHAIKPLDNALLRAKNAYLSYIENAINKNIGVSETNKQNVKSSNENTSTAHAILTTTSRSKR